MLIVICGIGALGSTAAVLCRNLDATLRLVDFDRVESKNLASQAFVKQSLGKNKAAALKQQLANFHGIAVEAVGVRLGDHNATELLGDAGLVVDCLDNIEGRTAIMRWVRTHGTPCVHAGLSADASFGLVRWDPEFVPDAEDEPGQPTCEGGAHLPMIGLVAAALARAVQAFVDSGTAYDCIVNRNGVASYPVARG